MQIPVASEDIGIGYCEIDNMTSKSQKTSFYNRVSMVGIFLAVLLYAVLSCSSPAGADPLKRLSDSQFASELMEMTGEYDEDVTPEQAERNPYILERLIVKSSNHYLDPEDYGAIEGIQDRDGTYILQFDSVSAAKRAEIKLSKDAATDYVEPDAVVYASADDSNYLSAASDSSVQWNIQQMAFDRYADYIIEKGKNIPITVAVLDTGISFSHPLLSNRLNKTLAKSYICESCYSNKYPKANGEMEDPDEDKQDNTIKTNHGTHVAGIIAQCTEGLNVTILPVRVLRSKYGTGCMSTLCAGIDYAAGQGAKVINMSLAGSASTRSDALEESIKNAINRGSIVVVSAGNGEKKDNGSYEAVDISANNVTPAYISDCIVVGSVDDSKTRALTSNYGTTLDVVAPGVNIWSSIVKGSGSKYGYMTGTSMSAPHVAAEAALLCMVYRNYTPGQIEQLIKDTAFDDSEIPGRDDYCGSGFASLYKLLPYTVTYSPGDYGTFASRSYTVQYGSSTPAAPSTTGKTGYSFAGWSPSVSQTVVKDVVYTAQWTKTGDTDEEIRAKEAEAARKAREAARFAGSDPHANVSYKVPLKKNQKTKALKVLGFAGEDRVVSWKSSDTTRATVNGNPNGTCTVKAGKKTGNAVITATCASGREVSFRIKVQKNKVKTKKIRIASKVVTMSVGETLQLDPELYPITSIDKIKYTLKNKGIVTVAKTGVVTARTKGTAKIVIASGGKKITVKIVVQ